MMDGHASPASGAGEGARAAQPSCHCQALRQAARRATALYDAAMVPFGLRISQYAILARLRQFGPCSLQALAAPLVLDRTTLARNLRALERDGLVASVADPADRRVRLVHLTGPGLQVLRRARPAWRAAQAAYEAQVGVAAAAALRQELHRVVQAVEEAGEG